jgi:hypothetical protein
MLRAASFSGWWNCIVLAIDILKDKIKHEYVPGT